MLLLSPRVAALSFAEDATPELPARVWRDYSDEYLKQLRADFGLDDIVKGGQTDLDRAAAVSKWVHGLWEHDGRNQPRQPDPAYILREVARGQRFRCVEYATVVSGCLQAIGFQTRTLSLRRADMETRAYGAGHVVAEAFLPDLGKWVLIDCQWNAIPLVAGVPLHAVELQRALADRSAGLVFLGLTGLESIRYRYWIAPYLYYFQVPYGDTKLMLGPVGAKQPTLFQRVHPVGEIRYTHALADFYRLSTLFGS